jgi:hypothetical protein
MTPPHAVCRLCRKPIASSRTVHWYGMGRRDLDERVHLECGERAVEEGKR